MSLDFLILFSKSSTECGYLSDTFLEEQIDGQAFMLLNLPTVQQFLRLKIGPAIRLCHIIERVKLGFFLGYCGRDDDEEDDDDDDDEDEREEEEEEVEEEEEESNGLNVLPSDGGVDAARANVSERADPVSLAVGCE